MLIAVAGPYSAGTEEEKAKNLEAMNIAAAEVYRKGHIPVIGVNASLFVAEKLAGLPGKEVINNISFAIVERCDAILVTGSSPGADMEREIIKNKGLPVYYSVEEIPENSNHTKYMSLELFSARLILRVLSGDDAEMFFDFLLRNKEFFRPWSPAYDSDYESLDYHKKMLERSKTETTDGRHYKFGVFKKDDPGKIIGSVALSNIAMGNFRSCFLGYRLDEMENSKGYATEAIQHVIKFAFEELGLHRIESNILLSNKLSIRTAEKCGFVYEGSSSKYLQINGKWEDHLHYVILNEKL